MIDRPVQSSPAHFCQLTSPSITSNKIYDARRPAPAVTAFKCCFTHPLKQFRTIWKNTQERIQLWLSRKKNKSFIIYFIGDVMTSSLLLIDGITDLVFTFLPLSSVGLSSGCVLNACTLGFTAQSAVPLHGSLH